jgi:hypothetical protein
MCYPNLIRIRPWWAGLTLLLVPGIAVAQAGKVITIGPGGNVVPRRQRDGVLLDRAIREGRSVTPEKAVESVRRFCRDPNLQVSVELFRENAQHLGRVASHFTLRVENGPWAGVYTVRAEDGSVQTWFASRPDEPDEDLAPVISPQTAEQLAKQFARERIPAFDRRIWRTPREYPIAAGRSSDFIWTEVLNSFGTLACWSLELTVDRATGRVVSYAAPQDQFHGPLVPRITRDRAIQLASRVAAYDPKRLPFGEITLEATEDRYGVQGLIWSLVQFPDPHRLEYFSSVLVSARTGEVAGPPGPLSAISATPRRTTAASGQPGKPLIRPASGEPIRSAPLEHRNGALWARAELLRGLGAIVAVTPEHLLVRTADSRGDEKTLAAERRSDGWWVPIRTACTALGWKARWDSKAQQVVVDSAPTSRN